MLSVLRSCSSARPRASALTSRLTPVARTRGAARLSYGRWWFRAPGCAPSLESNSVRDRLGDIGTSRSVHLWAAFAAVCLLLLPAWAADPNPLEKPLPSEEEVRQGILTEAARADEASRQFEKHYGYTRVETRTERNSRGKLRHHDESRWTCLPIGNAEDPDPNASAPNDSTQEPGVRTYKERDIQINEDLLRRFDLHVRGRETVDDRLVLRVDFQARAGALPEKNLLDRFINRSSGTVWLTEPDYATVRALFRLNQKVEFAYGIAGAVYSFEGTLDRTQTREGAWYSRQSRWKSDYREFLIRRVVEFSEVRTEVERVR